MEQMVEYLIVAHSCKTLNYVGGPADSQENLLRWQAYEDVLQRYGIPLENDRIWNESYEVESGVRAFIHFQKKWEPDIRFPETALIRAVLSALF
jgi:DNA-binding LacI/PurR family transcriptional regulator